MSIKSKVIEKWLKARESYLYLFRSNRKFTNILSVLKKVLQVFVVSEFLRHLLGFVLVLLISAATYKHTLGNFSSVYKHTTHGKKVSLSSQQSSAVPDKHFYNEINTHQDRRQALTTADDLHLWEKYRLPFPCLMLLPQCWSKNSEITQHVLVISLTLAARRRTYEHFQRSLDFGYFSYPALSHLNELIKGLIVTWGVKLSMLEWGPKWKWWCLQN